MTTYEMLEKIFEDLKQQILADEAQANIFSESLLRAKIDRAYREVKRARNYPKHYAESWIEEDMLNYYSNIEAIAEYDYGSVGAEGMSSYSSDGTSIHYKNRNELFSGVYPISR